MLKALIQVLLQGVGMMDRWTGFLEKWANKRHLIHFLLKLDIDISNQPLTLITIIEHDVGIQGVDTNITSNML